MAYLTWYTDPERKPSDIHFAGQEPQAEAVMEFDATLLEDYSRAADVTEFPVEEGSDISDHMQPKQPAITLEVFVSDTPTEVPTTFADATGNNQATPLELRQYPPQPPSLPTSGRFFRNNTDLARVLIPNKGTKGPGASSANVLVFTGRLNRVVNIFFELNRHMDEKTALTVVLAASKNFAETSALTFENMLISNIQTPRRAENGSGVIFIVDLQQVRIASRKTGTTTAAEPFPAQNRGAPEKNDGRRNPTAEDRARVKEKLENNDNPVHPIFGRIR